MKDYEWFDLLENPQGRLVRVLPKLFKHFSQFGNAGAWYPKGQIVLMMSLDGWEEQLAAAKGGLKRLDEFYTSSFATASSAGGSDCAFFTAILDGRLVRIGLTIHDIELIGPAEE